jgi:chemotaxis signal transduction protein
MPWRWRGLANVLLLSFFLGPVECAMSCKPIIEIVPPVILNPIPGAPPDLVGQFNYRGYVAPVVCLRRLVMGEACRPGLSTRIILVRCAGRTRTIGLLAERVTSTISIDAGSFKPPPVDVRPMRFLLGIATTERGLVRLVDADELCTTLEKHMIVTDSNGLPRGES